MRIKFYFKLTVTDLTELMWLSFCFCSMLIQMRWKYSFTLVTPRDSSQPFLTFFWRSLVKLFFVELRVVFRVEDNPIMRGRSREGRWRNVLICPSIDHHCTLWQWQLATTKFRDDDKISLLELLYLIFCTG